MTPEIAAIRGIRAAEDAISPNCHPDVRNNEDLLNLIGHVREVTGKPVGFKAVIGAYGWLDNLFDAVWRRGIESAPDFVTVDGADGGTGATPMPLIDDMSLPLRESLPLLVDKLSEHGLRGTGQGRRLGKAGDPRGRSLGPMRRRRFHLLRTGIHVRPWLSGTNPVSS